MKSKNYPKWIVTVLTAGIGLAMPAVSHAQVVMTANDASGTSSFNAAGSWSPAGAPAAGSTYSTAGFLLRGPASGTSYTFAGDALTVGGGGGNPYNLNGTPNNNALLFKVNGQTLTINNLILDAGCVRDGNGSGNFATLAGNITITANGGQFLCQ